MRLGARPPRRVIWITCAWLTALVACDGSERRPPDPSPPPSVAVLIDRTEGLRGVIYVTAGPGGLDADLYRVELDPLRVTRLTTGRRVSQIDGCPRGLFAAAPAPLGDALFQIRNEELKLLPNLRRRHAAGPAASFDCSRVAYARDPDGNLITSWSVRVWDVERARLDYAITDRRNLGTIVWGPGDALTLIRRGEASVAVGKQRSEFRVPEGTVFAKWSPARRLAVSTKDLAVFVSRQDGSFQRVAGGWIVQDWGPDGRTLLLRRLHKPVLGIYRLGSRGVKAIARFDVPGIFEAEWLTAIP